MNANPDRLWQILGIVAKEETYLNAVMLRLFPKHGDISPAWLKALLDTPEGIDRMESFVGKFSRMQDSIVDKLLPHFLLAVGETPGTALDNLRRAERLGIVGDPDLWLAMRRLRNRLIHEYVDDLAELAAALDMAHAATHELCNAFRGIKNYTEHNFPIDGNTLSDSH
ncbi:MAG: hypothetical protein ABL892_02090 [Thiobacillaceae bacterium]